jgi:hypothetical protein
MQARIDTLLQQLTAALDSWRDFARTEAGARLAPLHATLTGAAGGALVADRLVRSMWRHALFTGPQQWRTVALILTVLWLAIGAVTALALLGAVIDDPESQSAEPEAARPAPPLTPTHDAS